MKRQWEPGSWEPRIFNNGAVTFFNAGSPGSFSTISATPLAANASMVTAAYTIDQTDPSYPAFLVASDVGGTLYVEFSIDNGATWRLYSKTALTTGNGIAQINFAYQIAPMCRARYVNGAVAQTEFLLSVKN